MHFKRKGFVLFLILSISVNLFPNSAVALNSIELIKNGSFEITDENGTIVYPKSMEHFGQNFGFILYHHKIIGTYTPSRLRIYGMHDRAYVFINKVFKGVFYRNDKDTFIQTDEHYEGDEIDILVEAMGRVNYGAMLHDRKGIFGSVRLDNQALFNWDVYTLPFDNIDKIKYIDKANVPIFLRGKFKTESKDECFVHLDGFTKGCIWVNGFNLGRYWKIGPQKSLYLPGALLKDNNEIVVLELENYKKAEIKILDEHII